MSHGPVRLTSTERSIIEPIRGHAADGGVACALHFLSTGDVDGDVTTLSFVELDRLARAIAVQLLDDGARGERALLIYAPGLEFVASFLGCLYAGVVAVPAYPPDPMRMARTLPRLRAIARDSGARYFLTTSSLLPFVDAMNAQAPELAELRPLATDAVDSALAQRWLELAPSSDTLAFLQYTSGSTGTPRGVMVTHGNLIHNVRAILASCPRVPHSKMVSWLPSYHDMGLIGGILTPLVGGLDGIMMSPMAFLERPMRWLEAMSRYGSTVTASPNFALDLCVRRASDSEIAKLDLSKWMFAINGAEPVRPATLERFTRRFAPCGFRAEIHFPSYGLAEGTLLAAARRPAAAITCLELSRAELAQRRTRPARPNDRTSLVACGMAIEGQEIVIVDPASHRQLDADEVGEIWLRGPSVAAGYWSRPEESAHAFGAYIAGNERGPFLRTGDLGFLRDGELFIVGRLKDVIIVRGANYYPQDIEETALNAHPALRPGSLAAVAFEDEGEEQLGVVAELRPGMLAAELDAIVQSIREAVVNAHGIAPNNIALLTPGALPKTSSGKVQRHAARQGLIDGTLETVVSWPANVMTSHEAAPALALSSAEATDQTSSTLNFLRRALAEILRIDERSLDEARELAAQGVDSIALMEFLHSLQARFGEQITPAIIFENPSLRALAKALETMVPVTDGSGTHEPEAGSERVPLTLSQQALWFLHCLTPESPAYHVPMLLERSEGWQAERARRAVQSVVDRHEVLGQRLAFCDDALVHVPGPAFQWNEPEQLDVREASQAPFDLDAGPCLRVDFTPQAILFTVHHIVFDGYSCRVFLEDFLTAYQGAALPRARPYRDFVRWQNQFLASAEAQRQERYWLERFATLPPALDLPGDRVRPTRSRYRGDTIAFRFAASAVQQLARALATTPSAVMLAGFFALQHRYTAQQGADSELVIGTPLFGRSQPGFQRTIGYFVNMAAIRESVGAELSFGELVGRIGKRIREALAHGDYPFPRLIEKLSERLTLPRDPSRSPLFQTCFAFQGRAGLAPGADLVFQQEGQFDIELEIFEEGAEYAARWKFDSDLFTRETATRMAAHYRLLLAGAVDRPNTPIARLAYITDEERALTSRVNATTIAIDDSPLTIRGVADDVALTFPAGQWTYAQLQAKVMRLAQELAERGVGPESVVGVCLPRGPEMVLAIHAILHAGGAYLPIDPDWPDARIRFVLSDARPVGVFAPASFVRFAVPVWSCDAVRGVEQSAEHFASRARSEALAYVLYTSGSTGEPKGVLTEHRALSNRVRWMQSRYALRPTDAVLQKTAFTFDVSVWEFMWPLSVGARLVVPLPHAHLDVSAMQEIIACEGITTCHFVPSMLRVFLSQARVRAPALRQVFASGEALTSELVSRFHATYPEVELHNLYGPTEAAIDVSHWECRAGEHPVPIGLPVDNTRLHVLDAGDSEAGLWIPGELAIAGEQLARGYLNRPELTAQKFCHVDGFGRVYRTGDLARRRADGALEFLGRRDAQVKLRGVRIELGEVEATLRQHPGARAVAVTVHGEDAESQRLIAHVVGEAEESELSRFAEQRLPRLLVPSQFVFHRSFPLTPNGKLDRARLHAPTRSVAVHTGATLTPIERVFARFVSMEGLDTDFFRAGGTSLQAIHLVEVLRAECGIKLSLMDFYSAPSPRAVLEQRPAITPNLTAIVHELQQRLPSFESRAPAAPQHVLLTGGTGFFGSYLVQEWLSQSDATLYCLVRGYASRLPASPRIVPIEGDLASIPDTLADQIDTVVHNAARVNFLEPYERLASANVDGTLAILNFCARGKPKQLHYVSTASVFSGSDYARDNSVDEDDVPSASGLSSGYAASKWVAEQLVCAAKQRGLAVRIYRPGTLAGDSRTGRGARGDFFPCFLQGAKDLGVVPALDSWVSFLPVDWAAQVFVSLALQGSHPTYHLCHPEPIPLRELARRLALDVVPLAEFSARLEASPENALRPFLPLFTEPRGSQGESEAELSERLPRLETRHLLADLKKPSTNGPSVPAMSAELLDLYLGSARK